MKKNSAFHFVNRSKNYILFLYTIISNFYTLFVLQNSLKIQWNTLFFDSISILEKHSFAGEKSSHEVSHLINRQCSLHHFDTILKYEEEIIVSCHYTCNPYIWNEPCWNITKLSLYMYFTSSTLHHKQPQGKNITPKAIIFRYQIMKNCFIV